jgi:tRNA G37 N-methylase Trm5
MLLAEGKIKVIVGDSRLNCQLDSLLLACLYSFVLARRVRMNVLSGCAAFLDTLFACTKLRDRGSEVIDLHNQAREGLDLLFQHLLPRNVNASFRYDRKFIRASENQSSLAIPP